MLEDLLHEGCGQKVNTEQGEAVSLIPLDYQNNSFFMARRAIPIIAFHGV